MPAFTRALVTGASSGIGRAFAAELAARGCDLVVVARREPRLRELALDVAERHGTDVEVLPADLASADGRRHVAARLEQVERPVDLLVSNAGSGTHGRVAELDLQRLDDEVAVHVDATLHLCHAAARAMVVRGGDPAGGIITVASGTAHQAIPGDAVYAASKAWILTFTEALHAELARHDVHVTCLLPGFTRTGFQEEAGYDARLVPESLWHDPQDVVRVALQALARNAPVAIPGLVNRAHAAGIRVLPRGLVRRTVAAGSSWFGS